MTAEDNLKIRNRKSFHVVTAFLSMSLFIHLSLYLGLLKFLPQPATDQHQATPIEIIFKKNQQKKQQFVSDPDLGNIVKKLKKQSRFLSKFSRRVKKETVATKSGPTKNRVPKQASTQKITKRSEKKSKSKIKKWKSGLNFKTERNKQLKSSTTSIAASSTIAEHIPNVKSGGFTVLNTDQFTYYSFFKRVNEQVRLRWVNKIKKLSFSLPSQTINRLAAFPRETKVELILNQKGEFISSFVDQSSGADFLDRAPINAFIEASPFINPPQDLVDDDGYIRLNYSFFVNWESRRLAKKN